MRPVVVTQKYPVQVLAMRRPGQDARPAFLLLFSATQVLSGGAGSAAALGASLSRALARIGDAAVEFAADYGYGQGGADTRATVQVLRGLEGKLRELFASAFQTDNAKRFIEAVSNARSAQAGVPCFACVIDHPVGQATAQASLPARMSGEGVLGFGFFEPGRPTWIDALPRSRGNEVSDPYEFLVSGKV